MGALVSSLLARYRKDVMKTDGQAPEHERRIDPVTALAVDQVLLAQSALDVDAARRYALQVGADPAIVADVLRRPPGSVRAPGSAVVTRR
jgi:hypothetical protein